MVVDPVVANTLASCKLYSQTTGNDPEVAAYIEAYQRHNMTVPQLEALRHTSVLLVSMLTDILKCQVTLLLLFWPLRSV